MIKTYRGRKLGLRPAHRRMMLRQLATNLIHHEKITTTEARAKELKTYVDRMISRLKSLESPVRRERELRNWLAPNGLGAEKKFSTIVLPRYTTRQGGYARLIHLPPRKSDTAKLARIELLA